MKHTPDPINHQTCWCCYSTLPMSHFARNKYYKTGHINICGKCHSQNTTISRRKKYNWNVRVEITLIRQVKLHNATLITEAFGNRLSSFSYIGWSPRSNDSYTVSFTKGKWMDYALVLYKGDILENAYEFNIGPETGKDLLDILKRYWIRLERSEVELLEAKSQIFNVD